MTKTKINSRSNSSGKCNFFNVRAIASNPSSCMGTNPYWLTFGEAPYDSVYNGDVDMTKVYLAKISTTVSSGSLPRKKATSFRSTTAFPFMVGEYVCSDTDVSTYYVNGGN